MPELTASGPTWPSLTLHRGINEVRNGDIGLPTDETSIPLSRTKIFLLIAASIAFVAIGVWLWELPDASILPRRDPVFVHGVAIACVGFFGLCGILWIQKLFDRRQGLKFSNEGITDDSSGTSMGFIPWSDIAGFDVIEIKRTHFMTIKFKDPGKYLAKGGAVRQMLNRANMGLCGSPVAISSTALEIKFDDMKAMFDRYFAKYGRAA